MGEVIVPGTTSLYFRSLTLILRFRRQVRCELGFLIPLADQLAVGFIPSGKSTLDSSTRICTKH